MSEQCVGVVGVGVLGGHVARAMAANGLEVHVFDVRAEPVDALVASCPEIRAASTIETLAATCHHLSIVVRTDDQVAEVSNAVAPHLTPDHRVFIQSTVSIATVLDAAERLAASGAAVLDVPLCRPSGYGSGFVVLVGGDDRAVPGAMPILRAIDERVLVVGELGSAMAAKAIRNAVQYATYVTAAMADSLATTAGIDRSVLRELLTAAGNGSSALDLFLDLRAGWSADRGASIEERLGFAELAQKDLDVVLALSDEPHPLLRAVRDMVGDAYLARMFRS